MPMVGAGNHSMRNPDRRIVSCPVPERQPRVVNLEGDRRYGRPAGNVTLPLCTLERNGRVQSRTSIHGTDCGLLSVGSSANRNSNKPPEYILLLSRKEPVTSYTNQV